MSAIQESTKDYLVRAVGGPAGGCGLNRMHRGAARSH